VGEESPGETVSCSAGSADDNGAAPVEVEMGMGGGEGGPGEGSECVKGEESACQASCAALQSSSREPGSRRRKREDGEKLCQICDT
jgi:hypothetical protein